MPSAENLDDEELAARPRLARGEPQIGCRIAAVADDRVAGLAAERLEPRELAAVAVQHRGAARRQKLREEPFLGGPVLRHIAVVIEVVAGQVGERRGGDRQPVEPVLMQPMAGGFDRYMLDASPRQRGEIAMQRHRIGAGQGAGPMLGSGDQSERAEARRRVPDRRPDLAREMHDRGLAVGAGDGGDRARLPAIELRRQQRQPALRIGVRHDRDAAALFRRKGKGFGVVGKDGSGAARHGLARETAPVLPRAGQRREQKSRLNGSRIGRETGDLEVGEPGGRRHGSDQVSNSQPACPAGFRPSAPCGSRARISSTGCTPSSGAMRWVMRLFAGATVHPAVA